jgi:superfamily II DNA/RNA helicase
MILSENVKTVYLPLIRRQVLLGEKKEMTMSYQNRGRSRSQFGRSRGRPQFRGNRNRFAGKGASINPTKYINKVVVQTEEEQFQIQHAFADFDLQPELQASIKQQGYESPTPIQDQTIPLILQNKDVVGLAQTGTGKTAAFLLPLINKVLLDNQQGVLIIVPTRELASQISDEFQKFARGLPMSKVLCVGGLSMNNQIRSLRNNPHFIIGTPGRLKDLVDRGFIDLSLFTNIVLDEVDRMLDIGFIRDIRYLIDQMPKERQSLFFSATMTREAEGVMHSFSPSPEVVKIKSRDTSSQVDQDIVKIRPGLNKVDVLSDMLMQGDDFDKVIVFGRTKHGINKLEKILSQRGLKVTSIHGNKTQAARQRSLDDFKRGYVQALLATDVAARGIDIDDVSHVINYDEPNSYDDYIHRIGRTGRAGKVGKALTFIG